MNIHRQNITKLAEPVGPYTHVVQHGDILYTSGFTAFGSDAQHDTIDQQAIAIFDQLKIVATEMGSSLDKLIKVTIFVTEFEEMEALRDTLFSIYGTHIPASSLIKIDQLFAPELKIEIEAIFAQ
ncbi:RidA family protein [Curvivirga sp.]|uniref:RidA family protein n=1 Tax=Curvivirga sp. TaxID=2856848 RepID=UPI003B593142